MSPPELRDSGGQPGLWPGNKSIATREDVLKQRLSTLEARQTAYALRPNYHDEPLLGPQLPRQEGLWTGLTLQLREELVARREDWMKKLEEEYGAKIAKRAEVKGTEKMSLQVEGFRVPLDARFAFLEQSGERDAAYAFDSMSPGAMRFRTPESNEKHGTTSSNSTSKAPKRTRFGDLELVRQMEATPTAPSKQSEGMPSAIDGPSEREDTPTARSKKKVRFAVSSLNTKDNTPLARHLRKKYSSKPKQSKQVRFETPEEEVKKSTARATEISPYKLRTRYDEVIPHYSGEVAERMANFQRWQTKHVRFEAPETLAEKSTARATEISPYKLRTEYDELISQYDGEMAERMGNFQRWYIHGTEPEDAAETEMEACVKGQENGFLLLTSKDVVKERADNVDSGGWLQLL